jgi:hypothetical protein
MDLFKKIVTVAAFYLGLMSAPQAATLHYDKGQLTSASGVDVNGTLFDVEFGKTFFDYNASLYGYDKAAAGVLGMALYNQVISVKTANINGCTSDCVVYTFLEDASAKNVLGVYSDSYAYLEWIGGYGEAVKPKFQSIFQNLDPSYIMLAKWTPHSASVSAVPEPSANILMLIGFAIMVLLVKKRS